MLLSPLGALAASFLGIFGVLYSGATKKGEMDSEGVAVLRWVFLGILVLYGLLAITAFLG